MSWGYWGIVTGLAAMVIMLIGCIRLLSLDDQGEEQTSRLNAGESGDRDSRSVSDSQASCMNGMVLARSLWARGWGNVRVRRWEEDGCAHPNRERGEGVMGPTKRIVKGHARLRGRGGRVDQRWVHQPAGREVYVNPHYLVLPVVDRARATMVARWKAAIYCLHGARTTKRSTMSGSNFSDVRIVEVWDPHRRIRRRIGLHPLYVR
ncbi:MAG: hypothetical protein IPP12_17685 [Nitrospira sp.]|nr:hypothetical protein [Nitrospira sp.]